MGRQTLEPQSKKEKGGRANRLHRGVGRWRTALRRIAASKKKKKSSQIEGALGSAASVSASNTLGAIRRGSTTGKWFLKQTVVAMIM